MQGDAQLTMVSLMIRERLDESLQAYRGEEARRERAWHRLAQRRRAVCDTATEIANDAVRATQRRALPFG